MKCNLLLSINRRVSPAAAQRVIDLALRFRDETFATATTSNTALPAAAGAAVVGIDFCGDCYANTFAEFVPALRRAKDNGLPVTLHMGEKQDDAEVQQMVAFGPDRVGHCVFVSDSAREALRTRQVPVEVCITSNMLTGGLTEAKDHHVAEWLRGGNDHPVTINTDDSSVFSTTLCRELSLFAEIWFELFVARRRDVARKETATTSDSAVATRQAAVRFILGELWRVQFHAAKCAFVPRESDRAELLALLNATHEAAWRAQGWWCADA